MSGKKSKKSKQVGFQASEKTSSSRSGSNSRSNVQKTNDSEEDSLLDPPSFVLPDTSRGRYELWTLRLPIAVDLNDLEGCQITVPSHAPSVAASHEGKNGQQSGTTRFTSHGTDYTLQWGHAVENESFRVLIPKSAVVSNDDDSDDDNDASRRLVPSTMPFARHLNVVQAVLTVSEMDLAPRLNQGPAPSADTLVRKAYAPVAQKAGLKRRWAPLGGGVARDVAQNAVEATVTPSRHTPATRSPSWHTGAAATKRPTTDTTPLRDTESAKRVKQETEQDLPIKKEMETESERKARKAAKKEKKAAKQAKKEKQDRIKKEEKH